MTMKTLFKNLMALCTDESKFFYRDYESSLGMKYRVFSYNYASYNDWLLPDAMECRGIMFEMSQAGKPLRIASRPMEKFFNLNETPFTMNLDLSKVEYMMTKADGSLVSTYIDKDRVRFKSKSSIHSEQAVFASAMLESLEHQDLRDALYELAMNGYTANFEYVSPANRVVLQYEAKQLILLNVRDNDTGEYVPYDNLMTDGVLRRYLVEAFEVPEGDFVTDIRGREGIEGFVMVMEDGLRFKLKTEWYCALHHTKDSITNNERLFEVVVANGADDLRGMFSTDAFAIEKVEIFETVYRNYLALALTQCQSFYASHRGKSRKEYAGLAQVETKAAGLEMLFGVIMKMYEGTMDVDTLMDSIAKMFLKNSKRYIPKKYL